MNILITSIMGHIGYSLALHAKKNGLEVYGIINKTINISQIKELKKNKIKIFKVNLNDEKSIIKVLKNKKIDCCLHTAAVSHEIYAKKNPENTININCTAVLKIISAILKIKKKIKLINISTGSVFQEIKNSKSIGEEITPTPKSLYSCSKRLGEIIISNANNNLNINCTSLRISWVYGPPIVTKELNIQRGPIPMILYKFSKKNKNKFILKSGLDFRASFTYIEDVTSNIIRLIRKKSRLKDIYHLGTGKNNSLNEVFNSLKKINKKIAFKIGKGAKPWSNDSVMRGPIKSNNKYLKCKFNLQSGIVKYYDWLKQNA